MARTATTHTPQKAILGTLLQPGLPVDTDGLPGLTDAPVVYDLILRELREADVVTEGPAASEAALNLAGTQRQHRATDVESVPRDDQRRG